MEPSEQDVSSVVPEDAQQNEPKADSTDVSLAEVTKVEAGINSSKSVQIRGRQSTLFAATKASANKLRSRSYDDINATTQTEKKEMKLTVPMSPKLRVTKRIGRKPAPPTTEELEQQKVAKALEEERLRLQKAKMALLRFKVRVSQSKPTVVRSTKQLTIPSTPKLQLSKRLGTKKCSIVGPSQEHKKVNIARKLCTTQGGVTVVQPFNLAIDKRIPMEQVKEPMLTSAELASKFFVDPRSHDVPSNACKALTDARAPVLQTEKRAHNGAHPLPMSTEDKEKLLMEEIRQHPFKAKPVNHSVPAAVECHKVVEPKPLTQFKEFELKTELRSHERKSVLPTEETFVFKALPMPNFAAQPSSPTKPVSSFKPTIAISPKLHGSDRASSAPARRQKPHHAETEKQNAEEQRRKSTFSPRITEPKAFSFASDARGQAYQAMLAEKIKADREAEEAARNVKANPVPETIFKPFSVKTSNKELTNFQEFHLQSVQRHEMSEARLQSELHAEEERLKQEFKALPVPKTLYKKGFELEFEHHNLVVPINVHLESEIRASKRKAFDEAVAAQKSEEDRQKQEKLKLQLDKENEDIKQMRRMTIDKGGMVFVAKPIQTADNYPTKPPKSKPLTQPKSPYLRTKMRASVNQTVEETSLAHIDAF